MEVISGLGSGDRPKNVAWLLVHQGHMRLLGKPAEAVEPPEVRSVIAAGWEVHLDAAEEPGARIRARDVLTWMGCLFVSRLRWLTSLLNAK